MFFIDPRAEGSTELVCNFILFCSSGPGLDLTHSGHALADGHAVRMVSSLVSSISQHIFFRAFLPRIENIDSFSLVKKEKKNRESLMAQAGATKSRL